MTEEVKPCPFCGRQPRMFEYNGTLRVQCSTEQTQCAGADVVAPVAMWNRRMAMQLLPEPYLMKTATTFRAFDRGSIDIT